MEMESVTSAESYDSDDLFATFGQIPALRSSKIRAAIPGGSRAESQAGQSQISCARDHQRLSEDPLVFNFSGSYFALTEIFASEDYTYNPIRNRHALRTGA
jgi:hypothetical protein